MSSYDNERRYANQMLREAPDRGAPIDPHHEGLK
jgi:hypothetical protein